MTNILVVDDSNSIRDMVSFTLKSASYNVVEAKDGVDGLNKAKSETFDLVISDVNMPNMDGISMVIEIKKMSTYKFVPIIMLTALKPEHQQQIWRGIKQTDPDLAELLESDEAMKQLKAEFDGRLVMNRSDAEKYYKAGKK